MEDKAEIVLKIIEEMTIASQIKAICINNISTGLLIKRLLEDDEANGELLAYFAERVWTEINMLKEGKEGMRIFIMDIIV